MLDAPARASSAAPLVLLALLDQYAAQMETEGAPIPILRRVRLARSILADALVDAGLVEGEAKDGEGAEGDAAARPCLQP